MAGAEGVPSHVDVYCGLNQGRFKVSDSTVECLCAECSQSGAGPWVPQAWEKHCGKGACKKWRDTIKVVEAAGGGNIGKWLAARQGSVSTGSSPAASSTSEAKPQAAPEPQAVPAGPSTGAPRCREMAVFQSLKRGVFPKHLRAGAPVATPCRTSMRSAESSSSSSSSSSEEASDCGGAEGPALLEAEATTGGGQAVGEEAACVPRDDASKAPPSDSGDSSAGPGKEEAAEEGAGGAKAKAKAKGRAGPKKKEAPAAPAVPDAKEEACKAAEEAARARARAKGKAGPKWKAESKEAMPALPAAVKEEEEVKGKKAKAKPAPKKKAEQALLVPADVKQEAIEEEAAASATVKETQALEASQAAEGEESPNAALVEYLGSIKGKETRGLAHGLHFAVQRCFTLVRKARSPLNPDHAGLLRGFGGMLCRRVVGHFAKQEFRKLLPPGMPPPPPDKKAAGGSPGKKKAAPAAPKPPPPGGIASEVAALIDAALETGELGGNSNLGRPLQKALRQVREHLVVFLQLEDVRDLAMLRSCNAQLLNLFKAAFKAQKKEQRQREKKPASAKAKRKAKVEEAARSALDPVAPTPKAAPRKRRAAEALGASPEGSEGVSSEPKTAPKKRKPAANREVSSTPKPKKRKSTASPSSAKVKLEQPDGGAGEPPAAPRFDILETLPLGAVPRPAPALPERQLAPDSKRNAKIRPCKAFTGGWAIMVGLHLAGRPLKKMELVELSAARGLCREPLVKLQRTVGRGGQWYDAWSACSRLRRIGYVSRISGFRYALTAAGQAEAARYAEECERIRGGSCAQGALAADMTQGPQPSQKAAAPGVEEEGAKLEQEEDTTAGASLLADLPASQLPASQWEPPLSQPCASQWEPSASQSDFPASQMGTQKRRIRKKQVDDPEETIGKMKAEADSTWSVLVDTAEKTVVREALGGFLMEAAELRLPGVDYAFGRKTPDGDWALADIVVERKTVADFHSTLTSRRAELQARIHATLRGAGFRVAMVLEGVQDLRQNVHLIELLKEAYASHVDVLTTASLRDTSELLTGLVSAAREHSGWTVSMLRALLHPIYEPDPVDLARLALRALGIEKQVAEALARAYGGFSQLLKRLPSSGEDLEAAVQQLAAGAGLTLYQVGKALRVAGWEDAPMSRKRGISNVGPGLKVPKETRRPGKRWRRGLLMRDADAVLEVGPGLSAVFLGCLRVRIRVQENRNLAAGVLRVQRGSKSYTYGVGSSTVDLEPGKHWLILPKDSDWRAATFFAARAYACRGTVSSLCASAEQAARHVAACASALGKADAPVAETRAAWGGKREAGLAGVISLVRMDQGTIGTFFPAEVATNLARRLKIMAECTSLAQLLRKLREEGTESLTKLGCPDFGERRAAAIRNFLLGE